MHQVLLLIFRSSASSISEMYGPKISSVFATFVECIVFLRAVVGDQIDKRRYRYSHDDSELLHDAEGLLGSFFGTAVAINDQYLAVGSIGDGETPFRRSGSVYLYSTKNWKLLQKLLPIERGANFQFGSSLSICPTKGTLVVGSPYAKIVINGVSNNCGVAHIYEIDVHLHLHIQALQLYPVDGQQYDEYGKAIAVLEDVIAVAAPFHNSGRGVVYMYHRTDTLWVNHTVISVDLDDVSCFGHSVAMVDKVLAVSALHGNDAGERSSIFLFTLSNDGETWLQKSQIIPSKGSVGDEFGMSLALSNELLVVGSRYSSFNFEKSGAVYLYQNYDSVGWSELAILTARDGKTFGFFGDTVAIDRNTIAVGSFGWTAPDSKDIVGAVYIYLNSDHNWSESQVLLSSHGTTNDFFSKALAINGEVVAIGAAGDDLNNMNSGSAFHFDLSFKFESQLSDTDSSSSLTTSVLTYFMFFLSLCCCIYCMGYCPGQKWRRRFCKDWFGVSLGKKKRPIRKRHIRDINDVYHTPIKLDDSQSGYLDSAADANDLVSEGPISAPFELDGEIEALNNADKNEAHNALHTGNIELITLNEADRDTDSLFI